MPERTRPLSRWSRLNPLAVGVFSLAAVAFQPVTARASGISVQAFGGEHGTPMTTEPTAVFYNPAGIGNSIGAHVYGDLSLFFRHVTYDRTQADAPIPPGAEGANTGKATLFNVIPSPFLGGTYRYRSVTFGAAYYVPYGGQSSWNSNDAFRDNTTYPGAVDGTQRWYSIQGELRHTFWTLAAAYDFGPITVGLSGNLIQSKVNTVRAREPTGGDDLRLEGRSLLDVSSVDFSMGFGVMVEPIRHKLRVGVSYQTRPNIVGSIRASGKLQTLFVNGRSDKNDVDFQTTLPDSLRAGVSYQPHWHWEFRLFGTYERYSAIGDQCVVSPGTDCHVNQDGSADSNTILNAVRDWHDTFTVRAGVSYFPRQAIELMAGVGYLSNAVPSRTQEPALPDFNAIQAALGLGLKIGDHLHLSGTYTHLFSISRDTTGESVQSQLLLPSRSPDSGGKYTQWVGILNGNAEYIF